MLSAFGRLLTALIVAIGIMSVMNADATAAGTRMMSMPMHGNWCGPNHPSNALEATLPPIDALDNACRIHDICYASRGAGSCGCDIQLMNNLKRSFYPAPWLREKARAMYDAIGLMPCTDPMGMAYKQSCVWSDLARDTVSGRNPPWQMPLRFGKLGMSVMENKMRRGDWQD